MAPVKRKSGANYGPSEKREFHVFDKVFARMRGYPPWPAKITNIKVDAKSKSLKNKCEVYFYGTDQLGQCAFSDIHDYEANKERFQHCCQGSKNLRAVFSRALEQIENDNGPLLDEVDDGSVAKIAFDDSLEIEEEKRTGVKRKADTTDDDDDWDDAGIGIEGIASSSPGSAKIYKKRPPLQKKTTPTPSPRTSTAKTPQPKASPLSVNTKSTAEPVTGIAKSMASSNESDCAKSTWKTLIGDERLSVVKEEVNTTEKKRLRASDVHKSTPRPQKTWTKMLEEKELPVRTLKKEEGGTRPSKTSELRTECSLLALESDIKEALCLHTADFDRAVAAMKGVLDLRLTAMMLKKNPQVVDTYRKLERYHGEKVKRTLPQSQWSEFESRATQVRNLAARTIQTKFQTLFSMSPGLSFIQHYRDEMVWFLNKTAEMSTRAVLALTSHDGLK